MHKMALALIVVALSGCSSYNQHIRDCDGQDVGTTHLVLDYLPIGAAVDNGYCAVMGNSQPPQKHISQGINGQGSH